MIINHNMNALNAHRNMTANTAASGKSMEKLSSGLRINKAGDDAAGLAISEKMRGQIRGLDQASRNAQDGISLIQTAEGALNESHSIIQRMRELAVQAGNDTNTSADRDEIQKEINQLTSEVNRIANTTEFNTQKLLNGNKSGVAQQGVRAGANVAEKLGEMTTTVDVTGDVTIDGTKFVFNANADGADGTQFKDLDSLVTAINNNTTTSGKYTASTATTDLKLVQTVGSADVATIVDENNANGLTVAFDTGKEGAAAINSGDVIIPGTDGAAKLQIGANRNQSMTVEISDMSANALEITGTGTGFTANNTVTDGTSDVANEAALDVSTHENAANAIEAFDKALNKVSAERSKLGAMQNRLEHTINNLGTSSENLTAAESRVRDVDMAKEMMTFSKNNILSQAAQAMMAQANSQPQGVLQLLR